MPFNDAERIAAVRRGGGLAGASRPAVTGEPVAAPDVSPRLLAARAEKAAAHQRHEVKRAAHLAFIRERTPPGETPNWHEIAKASVAAGYHSATTNLGDVERVYQRTWLKRAAITATWAPPINFEV